MINYTKFSFEEIYKGSYSDNLVSFS